MEGEQSNIKRMKLVPKDKHQKLFDGGGGGMVMFKINTVVVADQGRGL